MLKFRTVRVIDMYLHTVRRCRMSRSMHQPRAASSHRYADHKAVLPTGAAAMRICRSSPGGPCLEPPLPSCAENSRRRLWTAGRRRCGRSSSRRCKGTVCSGVFAAGCLAALPSSVRPIFSCTPRCFAWLMQMLCGACAGNLS